MGERGIGVEGSEQEKAFAEVKLTEAGRVAYLLPAFATVVELEEGPFGLTRLLCLYFRD